VAAEKVRVFRYSLYLLICFTGTEVQILTQRVFRDGQALQYRRLPPQFTCFTGAEVQILTQRAFRDGQALQYRRLRHVV
jgi:hypothetical protein